MTCKMIHNSHTHDSQNHHKQYQSHYLNKTNNHVCRDIINKIYDDFRSRTCENCKHAETIDVVDNFRDNNIIDSYLRCEHMANMFEYGVVHPGFGCNKFERKNNE